MPDNSRHTTRKVLKQQTLVGFLNTSPPSSPSNPSPGPSMRKRTRKVSGHSDATLDTDSDVAAIRFEPKLVDTSDQEPSPRRPKWRKSLAGAHTIPTLAASDNSLEETTSVPRHRKAKNNVVLDSEDDTRPRKRKLIKGVRPPTPEEEDDDMDILEARNRERFGSQLSLFADNTSS